VYDDFIELHRICVSVLPYSGINKKSYGNLPDVEFLKLDTLQNNIGVYAWER